MPAPPSNPADELDLSAVIWLHADISGWAQTSTVTNVQISSRDICVEHTKAGQWPPYGGPGTEIGGKRGEGNPWVFAKINGQWYGGTFEWLGVGQECKEILPSVANIGAHVKVPPLGRPDGSASLWVPKSGEVVGFAMSTPARNNLSTTNERTNVVLVTWP